MNDDYYLHLFDLLEQAQKWPADERRPRAESACADGPVPAADLLAALQRAGNLNDFLENPAWQENRSNLEPATEPRQSTDAEDWLGRRVGRYRLEKVLGSGGMGQVFLAEQQEPRRQVALKLIKSEVVSNTAIERFRAEQQALARLNHPHVAQFLDADMTAEGRPFFAMELVEGQPIDRYVENAVLDLNQRLRLFLDVCAAVGHAHQKQIVHRDLKPSNVLVREIDGRPMAKVIDFGIAQALDRPTADLNITESGSVYGTPEYLSPESFDGDVDTRADIYALGVLLYQLVTGARPFRRGDSHPMELIERIRKGDKEAAGLKALKSGGPPYGWARRLRGDLEAIIDRAMATDRRRRYGSVSDLMADIDNFLGRRPVSAREAGSWHQLRLFFQRRRGPAIAALITCCSILVGVGAGAFGLLRARQEAESARQALQESEAMTVFLTGLFEQSDPSQARGEEITARELLDQGVERLESSLQGHPKVRAQMTRTIGDIYSKLGHYDQAEPLLLESLKLFEEQFGSDHLQMARALSGLGVMKGQAGDAGGSADYFERALAVLDLDPKMDPDLTALTVYHLGVLAFRDQRFDEAAEHFDRSCDLWHQNDGDAEYRGRCLDALGAIRKEQNRPQEALEYSVRSLRLREQALGPDHLHVASSHETLCSLARDLMRLSEAEESCLRALAIRRRALGDNHEQTTRSLRALSSVYQLGGDHDQAESLLRQALAVDQDAGRDKATARSWIRLGWLSWLQGRYAEAEQRYRQAASLLPESLDRSSLTALAQHGLGIALWKQGRLDEAQSLLQQNLDFRLQLNGPTGRQTAWPMWSLAGIYRDRGGPENLARAEQLYLQALKVRRALFPETHSFRAVVEADYRLLQALRDSDLGSNETS